MICLSLLPFVVSPAFAADSLRVFFFGNSLTGGTMPAWHADLGRSAGKSWESHAWLGAGWQLWQHREEIAATKDIFSATSNGDLTLDPSLIQSARSHVKAFWSENWDAVVLQLFSSYVTEITDSKWGRKLSGVKDAGDLGAASDLIRLQLARAPNSRVFIYQVWPMMDVGTVPPPEQLPTWAKGKQGIRTAEFPRRTDFNYAARWEQVYDPVASPKVNATKPWRSRAFSDQVFSGLKQRFPELSRQGQLRMIPAGELFFQLDRQLRGGGAPGITDIRDFYTDVQHIRAGLPRYAVAALLFACLFEESPARLDWKLYNDALKYGPDPHHDHGELLEITPARAQMVHDAIDALLEAHRRSRL